MDWVIQKFFLFPVNKTAETGYTATYLTHGMSVEFDAENDTWFKIGVNMQNPTNEDIIVYVEVENVEVRIVDEINSVIEWFDYLETPDEMKWDGSLEISLTEFPDVTFRWTYGEMLAVKGSKKHFTLYGDANLERLFLRPHWRRFA